MPEVIDAPITTTPAPETSSAAPATASAPVTSTTQTTASTPALAERPSDWRSLSKLMQGLDAKDAAADSTITAHQGAATTAPAVDPTKASEVPSTPQGPIPFEVHSRALENARTKAIDGYRQQYGWAENIPKEKLREWATFADRVNTDLPGIIAELTAAGMNHPTWGPQLRSSAGRTLAAAPSGPPQPDVQIVNAQGQVVGMTYSAEAQAKKDAWEWGQREAGVKQMIQPLIAERDTRLAKEQADAFNAEAQAASESHLARINRILEGKKELGPEVAKLVAANPGMDYYEAALEVRDRFITPNAEAAAKAAALESNLRKAHGNTASAAGVTTKRTLNPNSTVKEIAAFMAEQDRAS